ncbi:hypothetical protein KR067_001631, partial [Drosophila pandora]
IRKFSDIWNHFDDLGNQQAKCKFCKSILSSKSQSNLSRHLKSKHPAALEPVTRQIDDDSVVAVQNAQPKISTFVHRPVSENKLQCLDKQMVRTIAKGQHALRLVDEPEFKKLISDVSNCPGYKLPTRKTLTNALIPKLRDELTGTITEKLREAQAVCLTTDGWTSLTNESYMAVTVHFIDKESTSPNSYMLACRSFPIRHTSENLCQFLQTIISEWNIKNKVAAIASDNAANIVKAIQLGKRRHIGCFAHILNLIVQKALDGIGNVRAKAKSIAQYFNSSSTGLKKLEDMQILLKLPQLKIKQDVPTRWNSTLKMFERLLLLKEAVMATLSNLRIDLMLSAEDWEVIEGVIPVLQPFSQITTEISAEKNVTLSIIIVLSGILQKKITSILDNLKFDTNTSIVEFVKCIQTDMHTRFHDYEFNVLYAESTILDPRFKGRVFKSEEAYKKAVHDLKTKLISFHSATPHTESVRMDNACQVKANKNDNDIWKDYDNAFQKVSKPTNSTAAAIRELDKYLAEEYILRTDDPLVWWDQRKSQYSPLY